MNLHHLELFYYVARHGGIGKACAKIPYGIQQPAVSSQLLALENDLGTRLFRRRPFQLTSSGETLLAHLAPFFDGLPDLESKLRGEVGQELRIAGPSELLRFHVPAIALELRRSFPKLRLRVFETQHRDARQLVESGDAMLAVNALEFSLGSGFRSREFATLPLCLLHRKARGKSPEPLAAKLDRGEIPASDLIAPPPRESVTGVFFRALRERDIEWPVSIEASSGDQIAAYVAAGMGTGLWVDAPGVPSPDGVTIERLDAFPGIRIGAFWRGEPSPVAGAFLDLLAERTRELVGG